MLTNILRDAETDAVTRELLELRSGDPRARIRGVLAEALPRRKRVRAALDVAALDLHTWRAMARSGLSLGEAVEVAVRMIRCQ